MKLFDANFSKIISVGVIFDLVMAALFLFTVQKILVTY